MNIPGANKKKVVKNIRHGNTKRPIEYRTPSNRINMKAETSENNMSKGFLDFTGCLFRRHITSITFSRAQTE
jgi:hypothetical protein